MVGIDLAADPANTGVVELAVADDSVTVHPGPRPADDDTLVEAVRGARRVGLDCPLAWPEAFIEAVVGHQGFAGWPGPERTDLRFRRTDRVAMAAGHRPLSVSTDLIGVTALRGAHLQSRWAGEVWDAPAPRDGSGPLAETYPAAALRQWGLAATGYKGTRGRGLRDELVAELARLGGDRLDLGPVAEQAAASDHVLDAMLAALIALAIEVGATTWPSPEDVAAARIEGWIHWPTGELAEVVDRAVRTT